MIQQGPLPTRSSDVTNVTPLHDPPATQALPVMFRGTAREFFGIWIVNVLLSMVTIGIWSAWAKVRTRRWFCGHTDIDGHAFDYHATPVQILKGRLLAVALLALVGIAAWISPLLELMLWLALMLAMPAAINAGLRFNARMTSWRNVRFDFQGSYGRALVVFLLMPMAVVLSLGLLAPFQSRMAGQYLCQGYRFGGATFTTSPKLSALYRALGISTALFLAAMLPGLIALSLVGAGIFFLALLNFYAAVFISSLYYGSCVRNELFSQTRIQGGHRLQSQINPITYTWIVLSGFLATAATLTLAYPWACVRQYRYLMENTTLHAASGLDELVSDQQRAPGSFGGELSELEGFASVASF
ncbi:YjgN family protein [Achromobacter kerstersii]